MPAASTSSARTMSRSSCSPSRPLSWRRRLGAPLFPLLCTHHSVCLLKSPLPWPHQHLSPPISPPSLRIFCVLVSPSQPHPLHSIPWGPPCPLPSSGVPSLHPITCIPWCPPISFHPVPQFPSTPFTGVPSLPPPFFLWGSWGPPSIHPTPLVSSVLQEG